MSHHEAPGHHDPGQHTSGDDASGKDATDPPVDPDADPLRHWEARYAEKDGAVWSGRPNAALVSIVGDLTPGRAVDLGCGEGADAIWLASGGWQVTGVDLSPTAIGRAERAAEEAGVPPDRIRWVATDLMTWDGEPWHGGPVDLVSACFLHSPVELDRTAVLRRAAGIIAPGGHLLIVSHAAFPPWSSRHGHDHEFLTPEQEIAALELEPDAWTTVLAETRTREATGPDGEQATLDDTVVLLRRHPEHPTAAT